MDSKKYKLIYILLSLNLGKLASFAGAFILTTSALANPVLNNVGAGSVNFQRSPNTLTIQQNSPQAILNWNSFNIGAQEKTSFIQPAGGIALNRISPTQGPSSIYGVLTATGQIILVNPAGIYFGPSSVVNVGGLIATTANITNRDFLNRNYVFTNAGPGSIVNAGTIVARNHGLVALVGSNVTNSGHIQANLGHVVLATGEAFTVNFAGNHLINFKIGGKAGKVTNTGSLIANGGQVMVTAAAARNVLDNVINMQGVAQAKSVYKKGGEIIISGDPNGGMVKVASKMVASGKAKGQKGGKVKVTGYDVVIDSPTIIDVSGDIGGGLIQIGKDDFGTLSHSTTINDGVKLAANTVSGNGGFIETSGDYLAIKDISVDTTSTYGKTGTWLLDPTDLTIQNNGGINSNITNPFANTFQGNPNSNTSILDVGNLQTALASTNVIVETTAGGTGLGSGNITVADPITWSSSNSLSLQAINDIIINAAITALNGSLILQAGSLANTITTGAAGNISVANFNLVKGTWTQVGTLPTFNVSNNFQINSGIMPNTNAQFIRALSGDGSALTPYVLTDIYGVQGIGSSSTTLAQNFNLNNDIDASVTANWNAGAGFRPIGNSTTAFSGSLDGQNNTISNLFINSSGTVDTVGLFGTVNSTASTAIGNLTLSNPSITLNDGSSGFSNLFVGALVGKIVTNGIIDNVVIDGGSVTATGNKFDEVGGMVGAIVSATTSSAQVMNSSTNTTVSSSEQLDVGGLIGWNNGGSVSNSYALGSVTATNVNSESAGGLIGYMDAGGTVSNSYASGIISSASTQQFFGSGVGGLIGFADDNGSITSSYATGDVSGVNNVGGLIGQNYSAISSSYATGTVAGTGSLIGGLLGWNDASVTSSYATGDVSGFQRVGGLLGFNGGDSSYGATLISSSFATGDVSGLSSNTGNALIGGFIGDNQNFVNASYASGNVSGYGFNIGGFVGRSIEDAFVQAISNSYAIGQVYGQGGSANNIGGFAGSNFDGSINSSWASGLVLTDNLSAVIGGFIGTNGGGASLNNNFWDTDTTNQASGYGSSGAVVNLLGGCFTGVCSIQPNANSSNPGAAVNLSQEATYSGVGWSIDAAPAAGLPTWIIYEGLTRPFLSSENTSSIVTSHGLQAIGSTIASLSGSYTISENLNTSADTSNPSDLWGGNPTNFSIGTLANPFIGSLTFNQDNQTFTSSSLVLGAGAQINSTGNSTTLDAPITLTGAGNITFDVLTSLIIPQVIDGSTTTLTKSGAGTLEFQGGNTYTGSTDINAGILQVDSTGSLGATTNTVTVLSGATLLLNNATIGANPLNLNGTGVNPFGGGAALQSIGTSSYDGNINLVTTSIIGSVGTFTLNGVIDGPITSNLTLTGALALNNTFNLNNVNTYDGATTLGGIPLSSNHAVRVIATDANVFRDTSLIDMSYGELRYVLAGSGTSTNTNPIVLGGDNFGFSRIDYENTSALSGTLTLNNSILMNGTSSEFVTSLFGASVGPAILNIAGNIDLAGEGVRLSAFGGSDVVRVSGAITDGSVYTGSFAGIPNNGTVELNNASNTYAVETYISEGTLQLGSASALGSSTLFFWDNSNGTLTTAGNYNITNPYQVINTFVPNATGHLGGSNSFTMSGTGTIDSGTQLIVDNSAGTITLGSLTGGGSLVKDNSGTLTLSTANTYTGGTTINEGTLIVNNPQSLGTMGTIAITPNLFTLATLDLSAINSLSNTSSIDLTTVGFFNAAQLITSNTIALSNPITLTGNFNEFNVAANTTTLNGVISGTGAFVKEGIGNLVFGNTNNYTGDTFINTGVFTISGAGTLGASTSAVTVASGASLLLNNATLSNPLTLNGTGVDPANNQAALQGIGTSSYNGDITLASDSTIGSTGTFTLNGVISGANNLTFSEGTSLFGNIVLSNVNTYTGSTTLGDAAFTNRPTLTLTNAEALQGTSAINLFSSQLNFVLGAGAFTPSNSSTITMTGDALGFSRIDYENTSNGFGLLTLNNPIVMTGGATSHGFTTSLLGLSGLGPAFLDLNGSITGEVGFGSRFAATRAFDGIIVTGAILSGNVFIGSFFPGTSNLGLVELNNAGNSYAGSTILSEGNLQLDAATALGSSTLIFANSGTLFTDGNYNITNPYIVSNSVQNPNAIGTLGGFTDYTLSGPGTIDPGTQLIVNNESGTTITLNSLTGGGSLTKSNDGTLALIAANYTGSTTIDGGTLIADSLGNTAITINNSTLSLNNATITPTSLLLNNSTLASTGNSSINAPITLATGTTGIFDATGTLLIVNTVTGDNTTPLNLTGGGTITFAGDVDVASLDASAVSTNISTANVTTSGNQTYNALTIGASTLLSSTGGDVTIAGPLALNTFTTTIDSGNTIDIDGAVTGGTATLNLIGGGTASFGGTVNIGTLDAAAVATNLNATGGVTTSGNQTYNALNIGANTFLSSTNGDVAITGLFDVNNFTTAINTGINGISDISGNVTGSGGSLDINNANTGSDSTISGNIGGTLDLIKNGAGMLILSGVNSFTGTTTVNAGTLQIANGSSFSPNNNTMLNGGTLSLNNLTIAGGTITLQNGSTLDIIGNTTFGGDLVLVGANNFITPQAGANFTISGDINGSSALSINGAGGTVSLGDIGNITPLTQLTTNAIDIHLNGSISTTLNQLFNGGTVFIDGNTVFTTVNNPVDFDALDSTGVAANITFNLGTSRLAISGGPYSIGGTNPLGNIVLNASGNSFIDFIINAASFTTNGGGTMHLGGDVNTSGAQTYNSTVIADVASIALTGNSITLNNGLNDGGAGNAVTLNGVNLALNGPIASLTGLNINGIGANNTFTFNNPASQTWALTGNNTGTMTGVNTIGNTAFSNIQNITTGSGNDILRLQGFSLTGNFNAGAGVNRLFGGNNGNIWNITGSNSGSGLGITSFTNFQYLSGGTGSDAFNFIGAGRLAGNLSGGGGINTLAGLGPNNVWNITGLNTGTFSGLGGTFSGIQNLRGGAGSNTFNLANGARVSGFIDGGNTVTTTMNLSGWGVPVNVLLSTNKFNGMFVVGNTQIPYQNIGFVIGNGLGFLTATADQALQAVITGPLSGYIGDPLFWSGFQFNFPAPALPLVYPIIQQPDINSNGIYESNSVWVYQDEMNLENISDITIDAAWMNNKELNEVKVDPYCVAEAVESSGGGGE